MAELTIGRAVVVDVLDPTLGGIQSWETMTRFSKRQTTTRITSTAMNGRTVIRDLPMTWEGTMVFDRKDDRIDAYFAALEAAYRNRQDVPPAMITETIDEDGGGISQYRYTGVVMTLSNGGEAAGDSKIEMTVDWVATERRKVI